MNTTAAHLTHLLSLYAGSREDIFVYGAQTEFVHSYATTLAQGDVSRIYPLTTQLSAEDVRFIEERFATRSMRTAAQTVVFTAPHDFTSAYRAGTIPSLIYLHLHILPLEATKAL